jgi:hypothetical protein
MKLDQEYLQRISSAERDSYPFSHILIKDFLSQEKFRVLHSEVTSLEGSEPTKIFETSHGSKREYRNFPENLTETNTFLSTLASEEFCEILKKKFDVPLDLELKFDGTFDGGGYVISPPKSFLGYHADFNFSSNTNMYRSINILFYLNESYAPSQGGVLHLLDPITKTVEKSVEPRANTLLAFRTDDVSFHGVSKNNDGFYRRSFNIYYYTSRPISSNQAEIPHKTIWVDAEKHDH